MTVAFGSASFQAIERLQDRVGPIVVKEVRQGLRSKVFGVFFGLALVVCLLIALIVTSTQMGDGEYNSNTRLGRDTFFAFLMVLGVCCYFIIPYQAFRSLIREREDETWVLLALTGIGGFNIVRGKFLSAMSQALLFGSACVPFVVFSYYLNGVDMPLILMTLAMSAAWTALLVSICLWVAAEAKSRLGRTAANFVVLGGLGLAGIPGVAGSALMSQAPWRAGPSEALLLVVVVVVVALQSAVLLLRAAGAALSLPSEKGATGFRQYFAAFAIGDMVAIWAFSLILGVKQDTGIIAGVLFTLWLMPFTVLSVSERDGWPRASAARGWWKPGALRGASVAWGLLALVPFVFLPLEQLNSRFSSSRSTALSLVGGPLFVMLYSGGAAFMGRLEILERLGEQVATRLSFVVLVAAGVAIPAAVSVVVSNNSRVNEPTVNMLNPLIGMANLVDGRGNLFTVGILGFVTLITLLLARAALEERDRERLA